MLTFNLKKEWFEKIKNGVKDHEYREVKPYWTKRFCNKLCVKADELIDYKPPCSVIIRFLKGYRTDKWLSARLYSIRVIDGKYTDLKVDKPVYDIEFELI